MPEALGSMTAHSSVRDFFETFYSDDAPRSLSLFHDFIGDTQITATKWSSKPPLPHGQISAELAAQHTSAHCPDLSASILQDHFDDPTAKGEIPVGSAKKFRALEFSHGLGSSTPFGSKRTRVYKIQTCEFMGTGNAEVLLLSTTTKILDIPMGDAFVIMEQWTVEPGPSSFGEPICFLTATYQIKFIKKTLLRFMLAPKVKSELTDSFSKWTTFAQEHLIFGRSERLSVSEPDVLDDAGHGGEEISVHDVAEANDITEQNSNDAGVERDDFGFVPGAYGEEEDGNGTVAAAEFDFVEIREVSKHCFEGFELVGSPSDEWIMIPPTLSRA